MEVLQRTANRGSISTGPYEIDNSLKLEADNVERMQRSYASITSAGTPTSTKIATISFWLKRTELQSSGDRLCFLADANFTWIGFSNDGIYILGSTAGINLRSSGKFRDTSAWYHIVVAFDTTQSTASNRVKVYVNGEQWTEWGVSSNYGVQNNDIDLYDLNTSHYLGWSDAQSQSGYYAEFYLIDGQQLAPTEFGEFDSDSGIWKPKAYGGTFGVQGYHLDFEDSSALGDDVSGNGNNFTNLYNITSADQATDTPTNNFCTLNPLWTFGNTMGVSDGGTKVNNTVTAWGGAKGSIGVNSGKWYWEHGSFSGNDTMFGIQNQAGGGNAQAYLDPYTLALQANSNVIQFTDPSNRTESFSKTFSVSDIWGVALDLDANTIAYYRNGSIVNSAFSIDGLIGNGEFFPFVTHYGSGLNSRVNFGGYTGITISSAASDANGYGTFEYAPPSGHYSICTKNLAEYG